MQFWKISDTIIVYQCNDMSTVNNNMYELKKDTSVRMFCPSQVLLSVLLIVISWLFRDACIAKIWEGDYYPLLVPIARLHACPGMQHVPMPIPFLSTCTHPYWNHSPSFKHNYYDTDFIIVIDLSSLDFILSWRREDTREKVKVGANEGLDHYKAYVKYVYHGLYVQ